MWYSISLNKGELYMKYLLTLLCVTTLSSCGLKNKILNSMSGTLGVPKQPTHEVFAEIAPQIEPVQSQLQLTTQTQNSNVRSETTETEQSIMSAFKWHYTLPFIGIAIIALLVYRLKQQNLKSL